jgi:hypothetical protein
MSEKVDQKEYIYELEKILDQSENIGKILDRAEKLNMPNWYLGAGCIAQTVWNIKHGFNPDNGIKDYDLVYYDNSDISYEGEDKYIQKAKELFKDISVLVEIRNQARVHLWFSDKFGSSIEQFQSVEDAIKTWPTTATCVGVRRGGKELKVYAPYGLDDIFNMTVKANKKIVSEDVYNNKVSKWIKKWPNLKIILWNNN